MTLFIAVIAVACLFIHVTHDIINNGMSEILSFQYTLEFSDTGQVLEP